MTFLCALDLSLSNTGISIFTNDGRFVECLSIDTKAGKTTAQKLKIIGDRLLSLNNDYDFDVIIMEQGFSRWNISTQMLYRVHGLAQYIFNDVEQVYLAATTIKKEITGKGNAKKEQVRDAILDIYPDVNFMDLDQSDSYAIAITYLKRKGVI